MRLDLGITATGGVFFFLHSFSVCLEKNFLCVEMLRKHFKGFVSISSNTSNLSKATQGP